MGSSWATASSGTVAAAPAKSPPGVVHAPWPVAPELLHIMSMDTTCPTPRRRRFFFQGAGDWAEALVQRLGAHADSLLPLASHQADAMLEDAARVRPGRAGGRVAAGAGPLRTGRKQAAARCCAARSPGGLLVAWPGSLPTRSRGCLPFCCVRSARQQMATHMPPICASRCCPEAPQPSRRRRAAARCAALPRHAAVAAAAAAAAHCACHCF